MEYLITVHGPEPRAYVSSTLDYQFYIDRQLKPIANAVLVFLDLAMDGISNRFAEMLQEYVGKLGGGLVVVGGPQFGIREFHDTPIEDMLPVVIDPTESYNDDREFILRRTAHADRYAFMRLSTEDVENEKAWKNLGKLPWYQPVAALHKQAFALAEHPTAMCNDGKTPQPIIAVRPYGKGEVVYVGYNEMWRMRRKFGEKYYRIAHYDQMPAFFMSLVSGAAFIIHSPMMQ